MDRWRLSLIGLSSAAAFGATWSCAAFMDLGVDKYVLADGGDAPTSDSQLCDGAACPTLLLSCRSASDCDSGGVCCLALTTLTSVDFTCQPAKCSGAHPFQLCASNAECNGTECLRQQCMFDGIVVKDIKACTSLPGCVPF